ncbi:GDSL esterase/lipase At4g10955 [Physcomitrium patens]|uniref:Fungal lipase-type domain-containing protein n=2 Tax=Physcomitrium patens TaxID=3218 RepID=A9RY33_PHYPA|nr:GDSL esterase/lipase At4g10955-like [Physcomitrium patens]|eukprot:XP_024382415.1 GDSL esterase/lipase At4g10955-like [Physcomitrella patens]
MVGGELFIAGAIGVLGHKVRIEREGDEKLAKEDYEHMPLRSVMSMLVHCTYFRDLNILTTAGAWVMDYTNDRAKKYGKEHWEPYRCHATESVLKELGLAFFLRKPSHCNPVAPDLAIVLRGTIPTLIWDILADLKIAVETLNKSARVLDTVEIILEVVKDFRNQNPNGKICIAGHSLGAAIALIVGGLLHSAHDIKIDTHLFNPPLMTVVDVINGKAIPKPKAPENVEGDDLVPALEVKFSQLKDLLVRNKSALHNEWEQFKKLQNWVPHFYLNPGDAICYQYIKFYRQGRCVENPTDLISPQAVLSGLFTPNAKYFNDAVPSADVYVSTWKQEKRRLAHSLRQWHKYTPEHIKLEFRRARLLCHSRR